MYRRSLSCARKTAKTPPYACCRYMAGANHAIGRPVDRDFTQPFERGIFLICGLGTAYATLDGVAFLARIAVWST